jgi:ABC-2 type transport system ATP-binding protein
VIEECELEELREKRVRTLSGGQKRKVLVALALLADPEILILDEPSVGLDPVARRALWSTIEGQRAAGKTILLTTHYMEEAERLADRIGFIDGGRMMRTGTLASLYAQLGKSVRVTELDGADGSPRAQHYFDELGQAQAFVRERGFESYAVGHVSLEDIYLRVMGRGIAQGDAP